jgi:hypothetical protein
MDRTAVAVQQQITARGVETFEVGLFKPTASDEGRAVMIPRTWDTQTLFRSVPWLRLQNADGRNIYVRPKGEHDLSLVDDLNAEGITRMKASGFAPALVVETSPDNFQAWLRHPRRLPRDLSTVAARKLADTFGGDRGAADWRHFGRLAGFTNRKGKYVSSDGLYPFVRLIEATGRAYPQGAGFLESIAAEHERDLRARTRRQTSAAEEGRPLKTIEEFRSNPRYGGDDTRVDLAFAIYALTHGLDVNQVAGTIRSRDLSHKGDEKRQGQYVERTVTKALACAEGRSR